MAPTRANLSGLTAAQVSPLSNNSNESLRTSGGFFRMSMSRTPRPALPAVAPGTDVSPADWRD